jgi:tetratricopeptide (TPR) repeat protein
MVEHAEILVALGRLDRARSLLDDATAAFTAANDMGNAFGARLHVARAELAIARGDAREAHRSLDIALTIAKASSTPAALMLPRIAAGVAHSRPTHDDAQAMLDRLAGSGLLPAAIDDLHIDIVDKATLACAAGRLYLVVDRGDEARAWLASAVALRERLDAPQSPWLAEARDALAAAGSQHIVTKTSTTN